MDRIAPLADANVAVRELLQLWVSLDPFSALHTQLLASKSSTNFFKHDWTLNSPAQLKEAIVALERIDVIFQDSNEEVIVFRDPSIVQDIEQALLSSSQEKKTWYTHTLQFLSWASPGPYRHNIQWEQCKAIRPHIKSFLQKIRKLDKFEEIKGANLEAWVTLLTHFAFDSVYMADFEVAKALLDEVEVYLNAPESSLDVRRKAEHGDTLAFYYLDCLEESEHALELIERVLALKTEFKSEFSTPEIAHTMNLKTAALFKSEKDKEAEAYSAEVMTMLTPEGGEEGSLDPVGDVYAYALHLQGNSFRLRDEVEAAEKSYTSSFVLKIRALGRDHPTTQKTIINLSDIIKNRRSPEEAKVLIEEAIKVWVKELGETHELVVYGKQSLAEVYRLTGDYNKALEIFQQGVKTCKERYGDASPHTILSIRCLVRYHDSQGEYEVAKQYAEEIENCVRKYGSNNRKLASALLEHAAALQNLGKYDEAIKKSEEALVIAKKLFGANDPHCGYPLNLMANSYYYLGDCIKAEELYKLRLRLFDEDDPEYTTTLHNIANCYDKAGDMRSAEELYRRTTTWLEERARSPRAYAGILVDLAGAYCGLSAVLAKQYKDTEAESAVTRAIELYTDNLPPNHPFIARAYLKMANLLSFTNHSAEAQKYCTMALAILKTTLGPDHHETLDAAEFCKMLTTAKTQHAAAQKQGSSTKANAGTTPTSSQGLSHLRLRVWAVVGLFAAVAAGAFWASGRVLGR